jgi:hypothetical protein
MPDIALHLVGLQVVIGGEGRIGDLPAYHRLHYSCGVYLL